MNAPASLTINFDSNIISITGPSNMSGTITTSGESLGGSAADGMGYKFTVALQDGYIIDSISTELNEYCGYLDRFGADYFWIVAESGGINGTITITSKQAASKVSVDLTTLPGWSSLPSDTYSITIVAKADGYRDSEPSAAVSVTKGAQEYTDCITFTGETSDFTLAVGSNGAKEWDGTVEYSTDHNTWTTWNGAAVSSVNKKLYLRGSGNTTFYTSKGARLSLSARAACSGNIQTLLEYSNPPVAVASGCYRSMFSGCTNLTTAPALPATTLADNCYGNMFYGCTSLITAPELPATALANKCYWVMFQDCTNLTTAPELPATALADNCYSGMFWGCTSLTIAPALPATTLAGFCYSDMFLGCTNLTTAPELPATTLAMYCYNNMFYNCASLKISATQSSEYPTAWRIPSSGTISSTATVWNGSMLAGTGGTFTSAPSINTTYYGAW